MFEKLKMSIYKWYVQNFACSHNWKFDGHNGTDKESTHHWHVEECYNCEARREVMNHGATDDCGRYAPKPL